MSSKTPSIGFCGLGAMGFGMATNLVKKGYTVKGFDVYQKSVDRFKEAGGIPATTLQQSAEGNDFYIVMVATAQQAQSAIFDEANAIVKGLSQNATLLLCSTVPATYAQSAAEQLKSLGRSDVSFIDCPVSGGAVRAANGTLTIMTGASPDALNRGRWLLEEMSGPDKLFVVDGGIGQGSNMKMCHQVLAAIQILAASEAMGLAANLGLDLQRVREDVIKSDAWSWMFENRTTRMLEEDYFPGVSALTIILKDVGIVTSQARAVHFPVSLNSLAEQVYFSGLKLGFGPHDDAGMIRLYHSTPLRQTATQSNIAEQHHSQNTQSIIALLSSIHLLAAAEAIAFAHHLSIPLDQFYDLCVDAAGGSTMFREVGKLMIRGLEKDKDGLWKSIRAKNLNALIKDLSDVVSVAQEAKVPLYLGNAALGLLLMARERVGAESGEAGVLKVYGK